MQIRRQTIPVDAGAQGRVVDGAGNDKEDCNVPSINGARQGRRATVPRRRVRMWIRLGTHHTGTREKVEGESSACTMATSVKVGSS